MQCVARVLVDKLVHTHLCVFFIHVMNLSVYTWLSLYTFHQVCSVLQWTLVKSFETYN